MTATMTAASLETDLVSLRSEFLSYRGMCLTVEQVARLLGVRRDEAMWALSVLKDEGLLIRSANGKLPSCVAASLLTPASMARRRVA